VSDHMEMDGKPRLNLASFVTTWMEPECDKLIKNSFNKNIADLDEYPASAELQVRELCYYLKCAAPKRMRSRLVSS
jgi:glutamate decarboxylase